MKKIAFLVLFLFSILILFPSLVALSFSEQKEKSRTTAVPQVPVLHTDTNEIVCENLEDYLVGVVAAEMPASFHREALCAQAVAARTYILNRMESGEKSPDHPDAAVCTDSTHCKAWFSKEYMEESLGETWLSESYPKILEAVESTRGEILLYEQMPIVAVFHSTGSGKTENAEDVWGGALPYLRSVESAGDLDSPKFSSTTTVSKDEICKTLGVLIPTVGTYTRSEGGSVLAVDIGGFLFKGTDIRSYFHLNSANFEIEETETDFIFHVKGNGHGVGMSQYGANGMAQSGSTYPEILKTYYTGVEIEKKW